MSSEDRLMSHSNIYIVQSVFRFGRNIYFLFNPKGVVKLVQVTQRLCCKYCKMDMGHGPSVKFICRYVCCRKIFTKKERK
jgi:hypothetical protein